MRSPVMMSADNNIAINVQGVSKAYRIWRDPAARLKFPLFQAIGGLLPRTLQPKSLRQRIGGTHETPYYKDFYALQDVSFSVRKGEAVGIVGRNGSGKSTLLQIIASTLTPTTGEAKVNGRVAALLELGSGFNPEFTGRENVYLNAGILGFSRRETDAAIDEILAFAEIGDFIDQPIKTYSSGMTMRLAFAVQALTSPEVLIVDEALAVGDEAFQRKCLAKIERLKNAGTSILFVSHSPQDIIRFCDRALMIEHGRVVYIGEPAAVISLYQKFLYGSAETQDRILRAPESMLTTARAEKTAAGDPAQTPPRSSAEANPEDDFSHLEFFAPELRGAQEVRFDSHGAEIVDFALTTPADIPVNNIVVRRRYRISVNVAFSRHLHRVGIGVMFTDKSGINVAGASTWDCEDLLFDAAPGDTISKVFDFVCLLNPGTYFLRIGVATRAEGFVHRIMDAAAVRVSQGKPGCATGYADCGFTISDKSPAATP